MTQITRNPLAAAVVEENEKKADKAKRIAESFLQGIAGAELLDERGILVGNVKTLTATDSELFPDEPEENK